MQLVRTVFREGKCHDIQSRPVRCHTSFLGAPTRRLPPTHNSTVRWAPPSPSPSQVIYRALIYCNNCTVPQQINSYIPILCSVLCVLHNRRIRWLFPIRAWSFIKNRHSVLCSLFVVMEPLTYRQENTSTSNSVWACYLLPVTCVRVL